MIKADNIIDDFIAKIRANQYFSDKKVVCAYPYSVKPTVLKKVVVAAGIKEIHLSDASVGQNVKAGSYSVFADAFIPFALSDTVPRQIVSEICKSVIKDNIVSVYVSEIKASRTAQCLVLRMDLTFNDELCFDTEVNQNEQ